MPLLDHRPQDFRWTRGHRPRKSEEEMRPLPVDRIRDPHCHLAGRAVPSPSFLLKVERSLPIDQGRRPAARHRHHALVLDRPGSEIDAKIGLHEHLMRSGQSQDRETTLDLTRALQTCTRQPAEVLLVSRLGLAMVLDLVNLLATNVSTRAEDHRMAEDQVGLAETQISFVEGLRVVVNGQAVS